MRSNQEIIYAELSYKIVGILFGVHNQLGRYRNERQYGDAVEEALKKSGVRYEREATLDKSFEAELERRNRVDFLLEDKIILEIKAKRMIERRDYFQLQRYLVSANKDVNFQQKYLAPKRIINSKI